MSKAIKAMNISIVAEDGAFVRAYVNYDICMISDETMRKSEFLQIDFSAGELIDVNSVLSAVTSKVNTEEGIV